MIRVLAIRCSYPGDLVRDVFFGGRNIKPIGELINLRQARFHTVLIYQWDVLGLIEGTRGHCYAGLIQIAEEKRRTAVPAKTSLYVLGTAKNRWLAARPGEVLYRHANERKEEVARRFLAHPTMADVRAVTQGVGAIADGATLATAVPRLCFRWR